MYNFKWETFYALEYSIGISLEKTIECAVVHLHLPFTHSVKYSNFSPVILFNCKVGSYHCRWIPKAYLYKPISNIVTMQVSRAWDLVHACFTTKFKLIYHFYYEANLYVDSNAVAKYSHLNFSTQLKNNVHSKVCKNFHLVEEV